MNADDYIVKLKEVALKMLKIEYKDIFNTIDTLLLSIREPQTTSSGAIKLNALQRPIWKRNQEGQYVTYYNRLTDKQIEEFLINASLIKMDYQISILGLENKYIVSKLLYDKEMAEFTIKTQGRNKELRDADIYLKTMQKRWDKIIYDYMKQICKTIDDEIKSVIYMLSRIREYRFSSEKQLKYTEKAVKNENIQH
jgi:hypothetical protein